MGILRATMWLGGISGAMGVAAFLSGAGQATAVAIGLALPLLVAVAGALLYVLYVLWEIVPVYSLNRIDPTWPDKALRTMDRLDAAVYDWQIREFGHGSKSFMVPMDVSGDDVQFGSFIADNDTNPRDFEGDEDAFDQAYEAREHAIEALVPSDEAEERLHAELRKTLARNLSPELQRALVRHGKIVINADPEP